MLLHWRVKILNRSAQQSNLLLSNCILTRGIKVETLPTFDIEYLFLNIRGKSVGEEIDVNIICPDDEETSTAVKY